MAEQTQKDVKYTMLVSGLNYGGRNTELADKNYKDDIAILFDVVTSHDLSYTNTKSSFPIESRATRSDHIVAQDGKFNFTARVNTSPTYLIDRNYIDQDTDPENPVSSKRPQKALEILKKIRDDRVSLTLVTEDIILTDYAITELSVTRDASEGAALVFNISLEEFRTVEVGRTVLATTNSSSKGRTNKTAMQDNKSSGTKNSGDKDLTFYEQKSPLTNVWAKNMEEALKSSGINVPQRDQPAGVIKPDGTIVRN